MPAHTGPGRDPAHRVVEARHHDLLSRATLVGERRRYLYVVTPKAACSTMKHLLMDFEGRPAREWRQVGKQSTRSNAVHDLHGFRNIFGLDPQARVHLLNSPSVARFCVVRNPYARLASAWADKIWQREPEFFAVCERIGRFHGAAGPEHCPNFREFVQWVDACEDLAGCDRHWRTMSDCVLWGSIDYTHVLRTESLAGDLQRLLDHIEPGHDAASMLRRNTRNVSLPYDWKSLYGEELADAVYRMYQKDFVNFGYARDSWEPSRPAPAATDDWHARYLELEQEAWRIVRAKNEAIYDLVETRDRLSLELAQARAWNKPVARLFGTASALLGRAKRLIG